MTRLKHNPTSRKQMNAKAQDTPTYIITDTGLRKVKPYMFAFFAFTKQRWIGRAISEVFATEFHDRPAEYYRRAIEKGLIKVNGAKVELDYRMRNADLLETYMHRHEAPVLYSTIEFAFRSDELLVCNKPSSIPVHPTGRFRHNSLTNILKFEYGMPDLFYVNRIDRLTSGLVLIALNKHTAAALSKQMMDRDIRKTYLARVKGEFPLRDTYITCNEPINVVSNRVGLNAVSPDGKPCSTRFKRLSFNGITSVVQCEPLTGRTHQIRVHLQYLGFPIANDPIYCSSAWGEAMGKGGIAKQDMKHVIERVANSAFANEDPILAVDGTMPTDIYYDSGQDDVVDGCADCVLHRRDPIPEELCIWLHSWKYSSDLWSYESNMPDWALADFKGDQCLPDRFWKYGGRWDGIAKGEFI